MKQQSEENQKLKEVLENFAKDSSNVVQLEDEINMTNKKLEGLAFGGRVPQEVHQSMADPEPMLPDEFAFRQNDMRVGDLEEEERALMNLAAQEYD